MARVPRPGDCIAPRRSYDYFIPSPPPLNHLPPPLLYTSSHSSTNVDSPNNRLPETIFHTKMYPSRTAFHTRPLSQRRTFMNLNRPPPPPPAVSGFLVFQGLAVVLLADCAIAFAQDQQTTLRSICQSAGFWADAPSFSAEHTNTMDATE